MTSRKRRLTLSGVIGLMLLLAACSAPIDSDCAYCDECCLGDKCATGHGSAITDGAAADSTATSANSNRCAHCGCSHAHG